MVQAHDIERVFVKILPRKLTKGPKYHWFGYYDKLQFDPTGRFVLCMEVDFEGRSPTPADSVEVGMMDLADDNRWITLGRSTAWCWQQGCMLQWIPGSTDEIIYNDRLGEGFCAHIVNVTTGKRRTIPFPVYALSPDGQRALGLDFIRTGRLRPGYGYAGNDPTISDNAPENAGIYQIDLNTGKYRLIISIAQMAAIPCETHAPGSQHWFNHILFNPDGSRFIFLHRCNDSNGVISTRAVTANPDGGDMRILQNGGKFSHFIWRDPQSILAWARPGDVESPHCYLFDELTKKVQLVGPHAIMKDTHCTYLPGGEWIVNDACVSPDDRNQPLYLYHAESGTRIDLGTFNSPPEYDHDQRCDLHPRHSRDGRYLTIDSPHDGDGRQLYMLDISEITKKKKGSGTFSCDPAGYS